MNVLEKILEEINAFKRKVVFDKSDNQDYKTGYICALSVAEGIVTKFMDEVEMFEFDFNRVESFDCQCGRHYVNTCNDGWIPVEERLPEEKINPITKDFYVYPVTFELDGVRDIRYYPFGMGHWWKATEIMDEYVKAWMPIPASYKPKEKDDE